MLLGEPPRTQYDVNFRLFGFPVRIAAFFWLVALILGAGSLDNRHSVASQIILWILAVLLSILIHELGHALAFRYYGISSHIVLYHLGGLAVPDSYGSTAQRSAYVNDPRQNIVISVAGPALQIAAAMIVFLVMVAAAFLGIRLPPGAVANSVAQFLFISIFWALLNLLPIYPLDGGQIARNVFLLFGGENAIKHSLMLSVGTAAGIAVLGLFNGLQFLGIMCAMLAYSSYQVLQSYGGGFGSGYGRRW